MDWKLIQLMLRDHEGGKGKYNTVFTLRNTIRIFGEDTEFEEVKKELRIFYRELNSGLDKDNQEILGAISDNRFIEIVDRAKILIEEYYWNRRNDIDSD